MKKKRIDFVFYALPHELLLASCAWLWGLDLDPGIRRENVRKPFLLLRPAEVMNSLDPTNGGGGDKRGGHEKFKTLRSDGCYVEQKKKKAENQIINRQL